MSIVCLKYKRKPWLVKYREPWSGRPRQRAFAEEADARAFEVTQARLYERERAIIRAARRRRSQGRPASPTVAEVLSRYLDSLGNPSTRAASAYHLRLFADTHAAVLRMPNAAKGARAEAREVPLRSDIVRLLRRWEVEDAAVGCPWVIHYKGRPVRSISRAWRNTLRRAGIERRIRPYDLRHAFASRALDNAADLKCVAEIMGHANEKMIVRFYRHTSARARRKAVNAAPSLGLE